MDLLLEREVRVLSVSYQIRVAAVELCGDEVAPVLGLSAARRTDIGEVGREFWGLEDQIQVLHVLDGSPAARAGVRRGDLLLAINGRAIQKTEKIGEALRASRRGPLELRLQREESTLHPELPVVPACHHRVELVLTDALTTWQAYNREDLRVSTGLVRFVSSDDELAIAISHEIAHNVIGGWRESYSDAEPEADRLGLYIAARSGFDVSGALDYWERITLEHPWAIIFDKQSPDVRWSAYWRMRREPLHGRMPYRAAGIRRTVREIAERAERGEPIVP